MQESLDRIEKKVDRVYTTILDQSGRVSTLEESVRWLKGHVKVSITIAITIISALAVSLASLIIK